MTWRDSFVACANQGERIDRYKVSQWVRKFRLYKPPRRFAPCRLDFDTQLSSIATLPLSLPFRHHSWLPSIQIFLTLPWLPIVPYTSFLPPLSPSPFFPPSPPSSSFFLTPHFYMPIIRPRRHLWRNHNPCLYSYHTWRNNNSVELLRYRRRRPN